MARKVKNQNEYLIYNWLLMSFVAHKI